MRGEPIIVTSPGAAVPGEYDSQGNPLIGPETKRTINRVAVAPKGSEESAEAFGQKVVTGYTLYLPSGAILTADDRLEIRGVEGWQVEGDATAGQWTSPFSGRGKGVEVAVKRAS